jgi:A118 family predicted phage portal protein
MTLPTGGAWPPPPQNVALAQQALWSAWLVGDPEGLSAAYGAVGGGGYAAPTREASFEPLTSREGGVIPAVARFFWGRPSTSGQRKSRLHVPLAADIATASADLLFSEPPQFTVAEASDATKQRLDDHLNTGDFHASLVECAEIVAALGGGWLRLVWDKEVAGHVMLDTVAADSAIGEWRWNKLVAVTFFTEYRGSKGDQEVIRHLERHDPEAIYHGLYRGDAKTLGSARPLAEHPSTAPYVEFADEGGTTATIPTGVKSLTAAYVANMRPQRRWRKIEELVELGRSDYDGVEPLMDALDETYTSWMRDVRLARSRIIVPEFMLKDAGRGKGAYWDEDQEVFTALTIAPPQAGAPSQITAQQFAIRVKEHMDTAADLTGQILDAAGYSASTFGRNAEGTQTATEVTARERKSNRTRDKKTRYWSQALEPLLTTWLELDALLFATGASGEVTVAWPDAVQPDAEALSRTVETLNRAAAVSVDTKVRMLHADWDEEQIAAEVKRVMDETGMSVPDVGPVADQMMSTSQEEAVS